VKETLSRYIEELGQNEKQALVQEMLDKKNGYGDKDWSEIVEEYDLECSPDTLRKAGVGVKLASDAGMVFNLDDLESVDRGFVERQKMYDIQRGIRKDMREFSRTELICEYIREAIKSLPKIDLPKKTKLLPRNDGTKRELVVGLGDFHYGAEFMVFGLYGETINRYDSTVFEERMAVLLAEIKSIVERDKPEQVTLMIVGDMLDGMLRPSQLQRLEYGVIESAMRLAETLSVWLFNLEQAINIPIRVCAVRGNHGEIRPLGTKSGQFPEENMERIVMHYLRARFCDESLVWIVENDAPMTMVIDVCGYKYLLTHGHGVNIETMARDSVNLYNTPIDVFMVGHLHKGQTFQSGIMQNSNVYVERVPSICGVDPYAQSKGYGGAAGATAILMEEGYGRRCVYPIVLK
jgi:predicted phosphodiesterase